MERRVAFYVFMCLASGSLVSSEIHRVKPGSSKHAVKTDYVADTTNSLKVATSAEQQEFGNMFNANYETWVYSICGAILVGLTGIFPLLVIPMEAGPSLKHGGR